jgi:O-antigen/teichoic acid export membrane protein
VLIGKLSILEVPLLYGMAALLYLCASIRSLLNIRGHSMFASSMVVLEAVGRLLAFAAVAWILGASAQSLLLSSIVALGFEFIVLCWQARRVLPLSGASDALDPPLRVLRITFALAGGAASNIVQLQAYRVLFPAAGHASTSAALGVTANIGAVAMSACSQVFSQLFLPRLYRNGGAWIGRYVGWAVAMTAALLTLALLLSEYLVQHLTQAAYLPYAPAVGIGIVIEASNMLIGAYSVYLTLNGRAIMLFWFQLVGAIISLSACMITLNWRPDSPLLLGLAVAGSQILVTPALGFYVYRLQRRSR